jgi:hypothetical protein
MRTRTVTATALLALALGAAGCSSDHADDKPAKTTKADAASAAPSYTKADCRALLDENYEAGTSTDVSAEPECAALSHDQYVALVGQVLGSHKDEILADAADQAAWDMAWDGIDTDAQNDICDLLQTEGPAAAEGLSEDQAQYFLDNKC